MFEALVDFEVGVGKPEKVICPLIGECTNRCRWHMSNGQCAVTVIAIRLGALVEGVPFVQIYRNGDE